MPEYATQHTDPFASFVGNALSSYGMVKGFQRDAAEERRRRDEARQRNALFKMNLDREGYQEVDFTLPPDPSKRQSFVGRIGNRLLGRDTEPERDIRLLKMFPSAAERAATQARDLHVADREDTQAHAAQGWDRDDARSEREIAARAAEGERSSRTQTTVAGIYAGASQRADARANAEVDREQRDQFLSELAAATGGDPVKMQGIVSARPDLMAKARRWKIPGFAYSAVADAYRQRREVTDATAEAKKRTGESYLDTKRRLEREAQARGGTGTSGVAQQQAAWDRAAAALRAQGKTPESEIGPRPGAADATAQARTRALQLKAAGKTPDQIRAIMRSEGWNIE